MDEEEEQGWRDDMKFLFHLVKVFNHYVLFNKMVKVRFQALPGLTNARWNFRAIFALLSFILVPESRAQFGDARGFISGNWGKMWFGGQTFTARNYDELKEQVEKYPKAATCLETFCLETLRF